MASDIRRKADALKRQKPAILKMMGVEGVRAAKNNFEAEGMIRNGSVEKWRPKKKPNGKKVLTGKPLLKKAVKWWIVDSSVYVGVPPGVVPYAAIHQWGGGIPRKDGSTTQMPQRKYLEFTPDIDERIRKLLEFQLKKLK